MTDKDLFRLVIGCELVPFLDLSEAAEIPASFGRDTAILHHEFELMIAQVASYGIGRNLPSEFGTSPIRASLFNTVHRNGGFQTYGFGGHLLSDCAAGKLNSPAEYLNTIAATYDEDGEPPLRTEFDLGKQLNWERFAQKTRENIRDAELIAQAAYSNPALFSQLNVTSDFSFGLTSGFAFDLGVPIFGLVEITDERSHLQRLLPAIQADEKYFTTFKEK